MEIKEFVEKLNGCEKSTDLCQCLGTIYGEYLTAKCRRSSIDLDELHMICRVLHKHARKETPEKAFICGTYAAKFERLKEDIIDIKCEEKILEVLSDDENKKLFRFLFKSGCCKYKDIQEDFKNEDLLDRLGRFVDVGLAYCVELPTVTYFELTANGYVYFNKTIGRWGSRE